LTSLSWSSTAFPTGYGSAALVRSCCGRLFALQEAGTVLCPEEEAVPHWSQILEWLEQVACSSDDFSGSEGNKYSWGMDQAPDKIQIRRELARLASIRGSGRSEVSISAFL